MEFLEQIWEVIGNFFTGLSGSIERAITALFGSSNARYIKKLQPRVEAINALESKYEAMSDAELRQQTTLFRERLANGESLDDLLEDAFAVCRGGRQALSGNAPLRCATYRRNGAAQRLDCRNDHRRRQDVSGHAASLS